MIFKIMAAIMDGFVLVPLRFFGTSGGFCLVNSNELVMSLDIFAFEISKGQDISYVLLYRTERKQQKTDQVQ